MSRPVTSELIARAGATLAEGGWRYTRRQLYYATCAAAESPPRSPARNRFALGALLILVALIVLPIHLAALVLGVLAAVAIALGVVSLLTFRPAPGRPLAVSSTEFEQLLASEDLPSGLIDAGEPFPHDFGQGIVIVCDTAENAAAVAANLERAQLTHVAVTAAGTELPPGSTVIAVHDASPRGCALPLDLADSGYGVVDSGLRPAWVAGTTVQTLEGAAARLPRDLSATLRDDELDWLRSGRRVELAVLPPERLMALVRESLQRASEGRGAARPVVADESAPLGGQLLGLA